MIDDSASPVLVIQGPLRSAHRQDGRWGYLAEEYDCVENVLNLARRASRRYGSIVLSTWSDPGNMADVERFARLNTLGVSLVLSEDPLASPQCSGRRVRSKGFSDNRERQFVSTMAGLLHAGGDPRRLAVKVRTDQFVDVDELLDDVCRIGATRRHQAIGQFDFIYLPSLFAGGFYGADDAYFAGSVGDLIRYCSVQLRPYPAGHVASDIHSAMILRWMQAVWTRRHLWPRELLHPIPAKASGASSRPIMDPKHLEILADFLTTAVRPLSRNLYSGLIWRGEPITRYLDEDRRVGNEVEKYFDEDLPWAADEVLALLTSQAEGDRRSGVGVLRSASLFSYERCRFWPGPTWTRDLGAAAFRLARRLR